MRFFILILFITQLSTAQKIAVLKYSGGGDWYANPTALPNLIKFCNKNINTIIDETPETVEAGSTDIFQYPFVHMTGHGNVYFDDKATENLRTYLLSGGFLHIDDNYGMEPYIKRELKKIFPEKKLTELPASHPIFNQHYTFPSGLPKIHEHDGKRPQALGLFHENNLILLFTYESDLGDGWENPEVHNDPEEVRLKALQMGANIIAYAFQRKAD
ncbi:MAG: DUF4159 domain-containing protein [Bacteroidota bacterium]